MTKKLSVITSYRDRIESLEKYCDSIKLVGKDYIEFNIVSLGDNSEQAQALCKDHGINFHYIDYNGIFSTGMAHNIGVKKSEGEWILKQDVDCYFTENKYPDIIKYIEKENSDYLIIGCNNEWQCGNMYIIKKEDYLKIEGEPEWTGFGFEDYQFLYRVHKYFNPSFKLKKYNQSDIHVYIREQIVKPKNYKIFKKTRLVFEHLDHPRHTGSDYWKQTQINKMKLWESIKDIKGI